MQRQAVLPQRTYSATNVPGSAAVLRENRSDFVTMPASNVTKRLSPRP
jgi:hypothetical protein